MIVQNKACKRVTIDGRPRLSRDEIATDVQVGDGVVTVRHRTQGA